MTMPQALAGMEIVMRLRMLLALLASVTLATSAHCGPDRFGVTFVPGGTSRSEIEKAPNQADGMAWITYFRKSGYGALVARRTKPGRAEVHSSLTDVWYVIDGGGTLVTGGTLVDGKTTEPGEIRGRAISGGISHHLGKGDLIDIPAGVPHWVRAINGKELVYLTVKVATPAP
jgi:mannose-6-phosphate isomerase-like protein (cupin superfamily)